MNNYRTNCNNRRVMPGSSQCMQNMPNYQAQRMENMQDNCRSRVCMDMQSNREAECERSTNGTQNCKNNCDCSCNETQNNQNHNCECKEPACEQNCTCTCSCTCTCNNSQNNQDNNCDTMPESSACRPEPTFCEFPIGMAYVPIQQWRRLYDICAAFRNGTLFQELNLDFLGRRCN